MSQLALATEAVPAIEFSVAGVPLPQGSKFARVIGRGRSQRVILTDMADKATKTRKSGSLKRWKQCIAVKADAQIRGSSVGPVHLWRGPVILQCEFVFPRRPSHYTTKGNLTKSAPMVPQNDLDKLVRAVGDALTKVVYWDDVQVIGFGGTTKRFAKTRDAIGGVIIKVWEDTECG